MPASASPSWSAQLWKNLLFAGSDPHDINPLSSSLLPRLSRRFRLADIPARPRPGLSPRWTTDAAVKAHAAHG